MRVGGDLVAGRAKADRRRARRRRAIAACARSISSAMRAGAQADEVVRVRVRVAGELVPVARQRRPAPPAPRRRPPDRRRRRRRWRARRAARTARRSAAGSAAGSRSAPARAARRAARGCGSSRRSRRDRPTRCRCDLHYPALPCLSGVTTPAPISTASRCPSPRRTSSRSRCASRRCAIATASEIVLPDLGAGQLPGARLRPPRVPAGGHRRARPAARARAPRQAALADHAPAGAPFVVRYRVFAFEASVRTSFLDDSHGYWNGTSVFFYVAGELERPCRVTVAPPRALGWRVATALPPARARAQLRGGRLRRAGATPRSRSARTRRARSRSGARSSSWRSTAATTPTSRRLVDILRRIVAATGRMLRRLPVRPLPVHRARAAGRIGRPRAPRVGDDGHRRPVVRGRGRLQALRRSGGARVLPRLEREAHPRRRAGPLRLHARELHAPALAVRGLHRLPRPHHHAARGRHDATATSTG